MSLRRSLLAILSISAAPVALAQSAPPLSGPAPASPAGTATPPSLGPWDRSSEWRWQPVAIGAGGFMRGMVMHPSYADIRYARSDTWGAFRWDTRTQRWVQMVTPRAIPASATVARSDNLAQRYQLTANPLGGGVSSVAIDPRSRSRVYLAMAPSAPGDITGNAAFTGNVYASRDGGRTFTPARGLDLPGYVNSQCSDKELDAMNTRGERLGVDPNNPNVLYLGSQRNGLYMSNDTGASFRAVTGAGAPGACTNLINVLFDKRLTMRRVIGGKSMIVSRNIYIVGATTTVREGVDANGQKTRAELYTANIYRSADGGASWTDISTGPGAIFENPEDFGGTAIDGQGRVWITAGRKVAVYEGGQWRSTYVYRAGNAIAIDPTNPQHAYVSDPYTLGLSRTNDGGLTWTDLGENRSIRSGDGIDWINKRARHFPATASLMFDPNVPTAAGKGRLWASGGNDGIYYADLDEARQVDWTVGVDWVELAKGIEQMVGQNIVIPPGGNNAAILTVEDEVLFRVTNPTKFTAQHFDVDLTQGYNNNLASNGMVAYSPDTPSVMVTNPANLFASGYRGGAWETNFASYSVNYGQNWSILPSITVTPDHLRNTPNTLVAGQIAISARGNVLPGKGQPVWTGKDNIVWLTLGSPSPYWGFGSYNQPPRYSMDGGKTWEIGQVYDQNGQRVDFDNAGFQMIFGNAAKQFAVVADPVTPLTFYAVTVAKFMVTTDGGKTWRMNPGKASPFDPAYPFFINAKLKAVPGRKGDLWFTSGPGDPRAGGYLFHSTDGGLNWTRIPTAKTHEIAIGRGAPGTDYALYMYGKPTEAQPWGVWRSDDKGRNWYLVSGDGVTGYPMNTLNETSDLAASWDREGLLYISYGGMSFGWGYQKRLGIPYPN
ncbi:sialidase family protein [Novosphingobium sp.]|uniref:WD40/YVTN/BNR-like repeat-containing protein n=1 Tax=Novosphingobium sp. TaxID=1874826 RepID=UPI001D2D95C1|nr:sialidase family protein [Novosphingobium sp.]MBX9662233.1 glycoside hydrolase [Novosphingobium sp.]